MGSFVSLLTLCQQSRPNKKKILKINILPPTVLIVMIYLSFRFAWTFEFV